MLHCWNLNLEIPWWNWTTAVQTPAHLYCNSQCLQAGRYTCTHTLNHLPPSTHKHKNSWKTWPWKFMNVTFCTPGCSITPVWLSVWMEETDKAVTHFLLFTNTGMHLYQPCPQLTTQIATCCQCRNYMINIAYNQQMLLFSGLSSCKFLLVIWGMPYHNKAQMATMDRSAHQQNKCFLCGTRLKNKILRNQPVSDKACWSQYIFFTSWTGCRHNGQPNRISNRLHLEGTYQIIQ